MNIPLQRYLALLRTYLRPQRGRVLLLALLLLGSIALELLSPQLVRGFIDSALAGDPQTDLARMALLFIGVALVQQVLAVATTYVGQNVGWTATNALRADLAEHCLKLDLGFHKQRTPGELIERVDGDVTALSNFFSQFMIQVLGNILLLGGVLVLMFFEDWRIGLGLLLFAILAFVIMLRLREVAVPHWAKVRQLSAEFYGFLGEQLAGTEDVRANGATGYVMGRFYGYLRRWLPLTRRAGLAGYSLWMATIIIFALGNALAFALGAWLWGSGAITVGTVYLIFNYTELLRRPIEQLRVQLQDLQKAGASVGRVEELLRTTSRLVDGPGQPLPSGALPVELVGVWFGYDDTTDDPQLMEDGRRKTEGDIAAMATTSEPPTHDLPSTVFRPPSTERHLPSTVHRLPSMVIQDLTLSLAAGRTLGIIGRTGSGKTTLARLLLRLYDPTSGHIRLGGVDLRSTRQNELRQRIGMVTQEVQLFNASLRDNLTLFDPTVSDARILAALDDLGLSTWVASLAQGLDTVLEAGAGLSSGEAQLLALTRVFLREPGLVILDEASARLDPATERRIEQAIARLLAGRTGIIIAHRLGTVQRVDDILVLDNGQIAEFGPRDTLAANPASRFASLLRTGMAEVLA